jgi:ATP-dependent RNA helicase RhlE
MGGFRDGKFQILVATDIAARGIDVTQISHVINYDIPNTTDAYIHRIGRTGRAARSGDAYTLVTGEDTAMVRDIERILGSSIRRRTIDGFNYNVTAPRKEIEFARAPQQKAAPTRRAAEAQESRRREGSSSQPAATGMKKTPGKPGTPSSHKKYKVFKPRRTFN